MLGLPNELRGRFLVMPALVTFLCGFSASFVWFKGAGLCAEHNDPGSISANANINGLSNSIGCTVAPDLQLRMLAIGDSITAGWGGSEYWNSYRKDLKSFLDLDCPMKNRTYIGTVQTGNFANNNHEGYPGYSIDQIARNTHPMLDKSLLELPNVVFLHAGTNDLGELHGLPYKEAPDRLGKLMDTVLETVPNVTLLVAQIVFSAEPGSERGRRVREFNAQLPRVVEERVAKGFKVQLADLSSIGVATTDLSDGLHPSDVGYRKMAFKWFEALQNATRARLVSPYKT